MSDDQLFKNIKSTVPNRPGYSSNNHTCFIMAFSKPTFFTKLEKNILPLFMYKKT